MDCLQEILRGIHLSEVAQVLRHMQTLLLHILAKR